MHTAIQKTGSGGTGGAVRTSSHVRVKLLQAEPQGFQINGGGHTPKKMKQNRLTYNIYNFVLLLRHGNINSNVLQFQTDNY